MLEAVPTMPAPAPSLIKRLEQLGKRLLAWVAIGLFMRPGRARRLSAALAAPRSVLLVRLDNRVGEALLTTPLFTTLKALSPAPRVELLTHPKMQSVLEGHSALDAIHTIDRRGAWAGIFSPVLRKLRAARFDLVVNCANWSTPSVTSALVARLAAGRSALIGPATSPIDRLQDLSIESLHGTSSEVMQRLHLLSPVHGIVLQPRLSFRAPRVGAQVEALLQDLKTKAFAVVNPGGRLGWRRVPPWVFSAAVRILNGLEVLPLLTWGPGEEGLVQEIARSNPGSTVAPATTIDELAGLMKEARVTVCNNTGPMHLSVAVGCPTLALFLHMDLERWGYSKAPHAMLDLTPLISNPGAVKARLQASLPALLGR